jgi:hypothetical protein
VLLNAAFSLSFTQPEVDFVIPDLVADLSLAIDPFLLYKSRDAYLRGLHDRLLAIFSSGVRSYREGKLDELDRLINFPEVDEIGFGYSNRTIRGRGLGTRLNRLLAETLRVSPDLQDRGLRHIEELQLVAIGVGPDRVSDIAANTLKKFLIEYTQQQADLWDIPLTAGMPVNHYFDYDDWQWSDGFFDLPRNPVSGLPIILVPRRIVRHLPWINYTDYERTDFRMYLRAKQRSQAVDRANAAPPRLGKGEIIAVTRTELDILDKYITRKECESADAEPTLASGMISDRNVIERGDQLVERLGALPSGRVTASDYQHLVYEIFNYLFEPELTDGKLEEETHLGTERRDIVYANESERSFLKYVRETYSSLFLLLEIKNVKELELDHINQVAAYLGARLGMLGFIVTRNAFGKNIIQKTYSVHNDTPSISRKTILIVTDEDMVAMIRMKQRGDAPSSHLQGIYRNFILKVQ